MKIEKDTISYLVNGGLFIGIFVGVVACIFIISTGDLTNRESALLGLMLTMLSVLASWLLTHLYSKSQYQSAILEVKEEHKSNLRTYALKAAEKVNNLSNELNKLSLYLESELDESDYRSIEEELLAKEERIESAIHLIRTLKSINDTGLSDWEGVIGDELDQRREEQEEKEQELKLLINRVEELLEEKHVQPVQDRNSAHYVRNEIESLRKELRLATFQLSDSSIPRRSKRKEPKQDVRCDCPKCRNAISYKQRSSVRSIKQVLCKSCGVKLISTYSDESGFILVPRKVEEIGVNCPACNKLGAVSLENIPGSSSIVACNNCGEAFRVSRTGDNSIHIKQISKANAAASDLIKLSELSEEIIQSVRELLPQQPWPTGVHKTIAEQLFISNRLVTKAIDELIKRGDFLPQQNGVLHADF